MTTERKRISAHASAAADPFGFYLEPDGTVLAVHTSLYRQSSEGKIYEGFGALYSQANSPVVWTSISEDYLRLCRKISQREARHRHPALFARLDADAE
jgi:hypothetical protein